MRRAPTVSVVMPLYNAEATVAETLRTVQAQSMERWEAIVVNDGSTDGGPAIVERMAALDRRIRIVHQENAGVSAARNAALELATGEYVHCLDPDDLLEPHAYATLVETERSSGLGGAVGGHLVVDQRGETLHESRIPTYSIGLWDLVFRWSTWTGAHLVRRAFYEHVRFDTRFQAFEDRDCWIRLAERGVRWGCAAPIVARYVMRPGTLSKQSYNLLRCAQTVLTEMRERHRRLEPAVTLPDAATERFERMMHEHALNSVTRAVVIEGEEGVDRALGAYAHAREARAALICPERAAQAVRFAIVYGLGRKPGAEWIDRGSLAGVQAWWERCERMGWGAPGFAGRAWAALGLLLVSLEDVCERILDRCGGAPEILVVGFGQNGRALAQAARRRGVRICVRDDRFSAGLPGGDPDREGVVCERMEAPLKSGRPVVLSPLDDSGLLPRFSQAGRLVRWIECRDELVGRAPDGAIPAGGMGERSKVDAERTVASLR